MARLLIFLLSVAAPAALGAAPAAVASPDAVIRDCADDGTLNGRYSNRDLRKARDNLPSDLDEYSDCREVIGAAIGGEGDKRGSGGDGSGGAPSAEEQAARAADAQALERIAADRDRAPSVEVGGETLRPGSNGLFDIGSATHELPPWLLAALVGLGLLGLAGGALSLRRRVPALARIQLPSTFPTPRVTLPRRRR